MSAPRGDVVAVGCQHAGTVVFLDADTGTRIDTITLVSEPHELTFDARRRLIYVSHTYHSGWYFGNTGRTTAVSVVDADSRRVVDVIDIGPNHGPHDIRWDANSDLVFTTSEGGDGGSGALLVIDPATRRVADRVPVDAPGPHWFAMTWDGSTIYVANKESSFVSVVDVASRRMTGRVAVPGAEGIAVLPGDARVVVAGPVMLPSDRTAWNEDKGVRVVDVGAGSVSDVLPVEQQPMAVHVTASGALLVTETPTSITPNGSFDFPDGVVRVYDAQSLQLRGHLPIGGGALTVRSSADGAVAYIANMASGTVTVVDTDAVREVRTDPVDRGAHGLAIIPAA